jgi:hypothetical protein
LRAAAGAARVLVVFKNCNDVAFALYKYNVQVKAQAQAAAKRTERRNRK